MIIPPNDFSEKYEHPKRGTTEEKAREIVAQVRRVDSCYSNPIGVHDTEYLFNPIAAALEAEYQRRVKDGHQ